MPKKGQTKPDSQMRARYRKMRVNGKQVNVCRYVMEQKLGRPLQPGEQVHHINGDRLDDRPENLEVVTPKTHSIIHNAGKPLSKETREKMSKSRKGKKYPNRKSSTLEGNKRRSETMRKRRREHPEWWVNRWPNSD